MEQLFSTSEVCDLFKISKSTLKRRVSSGDFPPPRKIYPNGENRWTKTTINEVFAAMPIAEAYQNSSYYSKQAHCA